MSTHADRANGDRDWGDRHERTMFAVPVDMGDLTLRQAGVTDLDAMAALHAGDRRDGILRDEEAYALMSGGMLVAEERGRVVAAVMTRVAGIPNSPRGADVLLYWTVAPDRRHEGIGRRVALAAAARAVESGCDGVTAVAGPDDPGALAHLDAIGFDTGRAYPGKRTFATLEADMALELANGFGFRPH